MYFQPYIYICISLHGEVAVLVKRCYTQTDTLKPWDGPYYRMGPSKNKVNDVTGTSPPRVWIRKLLRNYRDTS